jgi:hypothetical protein
VLARQAAVLPCPWGCAGIALERLSLVKTDTIKVWTFQAEAQKAVDNSLSYRPIIREPYLPFVLEALPRDTTRRPFAEYSFYSSDAIIA